MTLLTALQEAEAATQAALPTAPWRAEGAMLYDCHGRPLLQHTFQGVDFGWNSDFDPAIPPEVVSYLVAVNPLAMLPLLRTLRRALAGENIKEAAVQTAEREDVCRAALRAWGAVEA